MKIRTFAVIVAVGLQVLVGSAQAKPLSQQTTRPISGGLSIGPADSATYMTDGVCWSATLGMWVTSGATGICPNSLPCMLSNHHVIDGAINLPPDLLFNLGDVITQAGPADLAMPIVNGKQTKTEFGSTHCNPALIAQDGAALSVGYVPMVPNDGDPYGPPANFVDASLAQAMNLVDVNPAILNIGIPSTTVLRPMVGMKVEAMGWGGLRTGKIIRIGAELSLHDNIGTNTYLFEDMTLTNWTPRFGDSGSVILTQGPKGCWHPISMVFADVQLAVGPIITASNPMYLVLGDLGETPPTQDFEPNSTTSLQPVGQNCGSNEQITDPALYDTVVANTADVADAETIVVNNAPNIMATTPGLNMLSVGADNNGNSIIYYTFDPYQAINDPGIINVVPSYLGSHPTEIEYAPPGLFLAGTSDPSQTSDIFNFPK